MLVGLLVWGGVVPGVCVVVGCVVCRRREVVVSVGLHPAARLRDASLSGCGGVAGFVVDGWCFLAGAGVWVCGAGGWWGLSVARLFRVAELG